MRKSLRIKLEDMRQDRLNELLHTVEKVFVRCNVDFYLLGASAVKKNQVAHENPISYLSSVKS
jgi:hypothetical protein